jgi:hypothetical protein
LEEVCLCAFFVAGVEDIAPRETVRNNYEIEVDRNFVLGTILCPEEMVRNKKSMKQ